APYADMPTGTVDECMQHHRTALFFQFQAVMAATGIKRLLLHGEARGVPVNPDDAARPRPGPALSVGSRDFFGVFAEERNLVFETGHFRLTLALRLIACALPKFEEIGERKDVLIMIFADTDIPGIGFANVKPEGVRSRCDAHSNIAIAQQHSFEEAGGGERPHNRMAARNFEAVEIAIRSGRCGRGGSDQGTGC